MHTYPNARLTPLGWERLLLRRRIDHGESLDFLAIQLGISVRTAYKWQALAVLLRWGMDVDFAALNG